MLPDPSVEPHVELAPWLALARLAVASGGFHARLVEHLASLPVRPYAPGSSAAGRDGTAAPDAAWSDAGARNLAVTVPGSAPSLRPLVLTARTDLLDPPALAALAATLAVPALLQNARLERDVVLVLVDEGGAAANRRTRAGQPEAERSGSHAWFEGQRRHDVKAVVVIERLRPTRLVTPGTDLLRIAGVETDARLPAVLADVAPPGCQVVLTRHGSDGFPFAAHGVPYLRIGDPASARPAADAGDDAAADAGDDAGAHAGDDAGAHAGDDVDHLERLARHAARLAATLLTRLDGARLPGPFNGYDSTEVELAAVVAALGPNLAAFGGPPRARSDLERVLAALG